MAENFEGFHKQENDAETLTTLNSQENTINFISRILELGDKEQAREHTEELEDTIFPSGEEIQEAVKRFNIPKEQLAVAIDSQLDYAVRELNTSSESLGAYREIILDICRKLYLKAENFTEETRSKAKKILEWSVYDFCFSDVPCEDFIEIFGFSSQDVEEIDAFMAEKIEEGEFDGVLANNLIVLGDTTTHFTKSFEACHERIFVLVPEDLDLADYFLERLDEYHALASVGKIMTEAVGHYSVAQKFIIAVEQDVKSWTKDPWVDDVLVHAKKIVASHESEELGGFSTVDPFERHQYRWDRGQVRLASVLAQAIEGGYRAQHWKNLESRTIYRKFFPK